MLFDPDGELATYLRETPIAYAAFRVMHIYVGSSQDAMAERQEVPFLSNLFFPLLLSGYVILRYSLVRIFGQRSSVRSADQLFTMTSASEYKTHSLLEVGESLSEKGETVVFLCSPATEDDRSEWEAQGFETVTFQELLGSVPLTELAWGFIRTARIIARLREIYPEGYVAAPRSLVFNVTFLEMIKTAALRNGTEEPVIHTYAPMPYLLKSTRRDRVLTYQHGMFQAVTGNVAMGYPYFLPITYFIWGEQWREKVGNLTHPDSELISTGSPWHDQLVERGQSECGTANGDVLFVSATHGLVDETEIKTYESIVGELIKECDSQGWSLAIKLHPSETSQWYDDRGWGEYVRTFDGILEALSTSQVAVTDASSAMIESALLGTPIIVTNSVKEPDIEAQISMANVHFAEPGDLGQAVESVLAETKGMEPETPSFADGTAVDQIVAVALSRSRSTVISTEHDS
jgi:hypothetical protein